MNARDIIIEFLQFSVRKRCTVLAIHILSEKFYISNTVLIHTLSEMVKNNDITINLQQPEYLTEIILVSKFSLVN